MGTIALDALHTQIIKTTRTQKLSHFSAARKVKKKKSNKLNCRNRELNERTVEATLNNYSVNSDIYRNT